LRYIYANVFEMFTSGDVHFQRRQGNKEKTSVSLTPAI